MSYSQLRGIRLQKPLPGATINWTDPLTRNLEACYLFNEGSGSRIRDATGKNSPGTFTGNVKFTSSINGSGLFFDGTNDVVRIPVSTASGLNLFAASQSFSVSAWFNPNGAGSINKIIIEKYQSGTPTPFALYITSGGVLAFEFYDSGGTGVSAQTATTIADNTWYYAVGVRDVLNDTAYIYLNGKLDGQAADTTTAGGTNTDDISIGNGGLSYTNDDFGGTINDCRIWTRALSGAEVWQLFQDPYRIFNSPRIYVSPVAANTYSGYYGYTAGWM